jgi:hypothetical protein
MIEIRSQADLALLRESVDLECKLAAGRDGQGAVPEDFWPTCSAFANTEGGVVILGLRERQGQFTVEGIANVAKVRKELFDSLNAGSSPNLPGSSVNLDPTSVNLPASSVNLDPSSPTSPEARDAEGCLLTDQLALPVIDDLSRLVLPLRARLEALAAEPRAKGKVDREVLIQVVLTLCDRRFVTLRCLAELVSRQPHTLRSQYLTRLVKDRKLSLAFPTTPTHERQAYCATASLPE